MHEKQVDYFLYKLFNSVCSNSSSKPCTFKLNNYDLRCNRSARNRQLHLMLLCALPLFSGQVDAELFERMPKFQILQHKGEITIKSDNKQKGLFIYLF